MKLEGLVHASVCFPLNDQGEALMGRKTRIIGVGLFNGPGGGIEEDETIDRGSVREVFDEVGVTIDQQWLERRAVVCCNNYKKDGVTPFVCKLYVSVAPVWTGTPTAGEELVDLRWFAPGHLPLDEMMAGDRDWVPRVLRGELLSAEVWYAPGMEALAKPTKVEPHTAEQLKRLWVLP